MNHLRSIYLMNLLWVFYGDGMTEHKSTITLLLEVFIFLTLLNPLLLLFKTKFRYFILQSEIKGKKV